MNKKWFDTNITILGLSLSGIAAAKYLNKKGANCTISEKREEKSEDLEKIKELNHLGINVEMGAHKEETILNADLVITSPGIPPRSEVIKLARQNKIQVISEVELAYLETSKPFIGITGTNGKTTTTKLISEILTNFGYKAPVCGNIGFPIINLVDDDVDYFVAELSSFQIDTSPTFKAQIGVFINYAPDHVDWHGSEEAYFAAKASMFTGHKSSGWSVLNACDPKIYDLKNNSFSKIVGFGKNTHDECVYIENNSIVSRNKGKTLNIINLNEIPLLGGHNLQNIMASIAVAVIVGVDIDTIKSTIMDFQPPEHRLEYVETIDGIAYYNDSKATNCDSTICALKAFGENKVVLIAGGRDKGTDLTEMVEAIKEHAASVVLIGEAADRFQQALVLLGYNAIHRTNTLEEAIDKASGLNQGPVLFAPACASFDMFRNFEERGRAFKDYVVKKISLSPIK